MGIETFIYPATRTVVPVGGAASISLYGPLASGGRITNPALAVDQGVPVAETLYVSLIGDAGLAADGSTFAIEPGQSFEILPGTTTNVSVNAATSGHRFSAFGSAPYVPYVPPTGTFPPDGPVTVTKVIPSYIYEQYSDDEDLPAFFSWFNGKSQEYVSWFANIGLPVYTGDAISGDLLDWIGAGLYGFPRPALPSGYNRNVGAINTWALNTIPLNTIEIIGNQNYYATNDDVYKRILTWHLYKGDGKVFNVRWLKRRIMRFLTGPNGTAGHVDDTSPVSVTFGVDNQVNIRIGVGTRRVVGGAMLNTMGLNAVGPVVTQRPVGPVNAQRPNQSPVNSLSFVENNPYRYPGAYGFFRHTLNSVVTVFTPTPSLELAPILKIAIDAGVCELPFQFTYDVQVGN